jgi:uncharacterized protein (DUF111 family)
MTSLGPVRVKVVSTQSGQRARPEYEDCRAIATRSGLALADAMRTIDSEIDQWLKQQV